MTIDEWIKAARPHAWAIRSGNPSLNAIEAVLELHKANIYGECCHCVDTSDAHWGIPWPCPTVQVITAELEADQ
jgi:transposase